jgi:hypothetical protein
LASLMARSLAQPKMAAAEVAPRLAAVLTDATVPRSKDAVAHSPSAGQAEAAASQVLAGAAAEGPPASAAAAEEQPSVPQRAAEEEFSAPQRAEEAAGEQPDAAARQQVEVQPASAALRRAALPSAAVSVFRRGRVLAVAVPARRRWARPVPGSARWQARRRFALPSALLWRAAGGEGLS